MTEAEWPGCEDLLDMLYFLKYVYRKPSERKLRLFACACCPPFSDPKVRKALEVAERLAEGLADERDQQAAKLSLNESDRPRARACAREVFTKLALIAPSR